jgi:membrane protein
MSGRRLAARVTGFAKEFYERLLQHKLLGASAELSYYFLFSIFPFLVFLVALAAYLPIQGAVSDVLTRLSRLMPKEAMDIIQNSLTELTRHRRPRLMSISILATIWSASRGVSALTSALNIAYGVQDRRGYLKIQASAIGMTLASALFICSAFALVVLGGKLGFQLASRLHSGRYYLALAAAVRWPLSAAVMMLSAAMNYYVLPDVKPGFWKIVPGAVLGTLLWLLCTLGFTKYAEHFGAYNATYGSLGGVIMLMTWLYLSGLSFLIGGEINALLCPPGRRPAPS